MTFSLLALDYLVVHSPVHAARGLGVTRGLGDVMELIKWDGLDLTSHTIPGNPRTLYIPLINRRRPLLIYVGRLIPNRYLGNTKLKANRTAPSIHQILA